MIVKKLFCRSLIIALFVPLYASVDHASAQSSFSNLINFRRVDADPEKDYTLTKEHGPWLVMATTFRGPGAEKDAQALVYELRKTYKLKAYSHHREFDFTGTQAGRGWNREGQPKRMRHVQDHKIQEVAVLVGDFDSVDDPKAQKVLKQIKYLKPEILAEGNKKTTQSFASLRKLHEKLLPNGSEAKKKGPMRQAILGTNPLVPKSYFKPKGVDSMIAKINSGVQYSLLDCRAPYTLKVATFRGSSAFDTKRIKKIEAGGEFKKSRLVEAAVKAHEVTIFLRQKGWEAYEFHGQYESIVTVGSFSSPGVRQADGRIVMEPQAQRIIDLFKAKPPKAKAGNPITIGVGARLQPWTLEVDKKTKKRIPLDMMPAMMDVPRRSIGSDYARRPKPLR